MKSRATFDVHPRVWGYIRLVHIFDNDHFAVVRVILAVCDLIVLISSCITTCTSISSPFAHKLSIDRVFPRFSYLVLDLAVASLTALVIKCQTGHLWLRKALVLRI